MLCVNLSCRCLYKPKSTKITIILRKKCARNAQKKIGLISLIINKKFKNKKTNQKCAKGSKKTPFKLRAGSDRMCYVVDACCTNYLLNPLCFFFAGLCAAAPGTGVGPNCSGTCALVTAWPRSFSILSNLYCSFSLMKV